MATSHKLQRERMEAVREANANKISMQEKELELKKQELQLRKEEQGTGEGATSFAIEHAHDDDAEVYGCSGR